MASREHSRNFGQPLWQSQLPSKLRQAPLGDESLRLFRHKAAHVGAGGFEAEGAGNFLGAVGGVDADIPFDGFENRRPDLDRGQHLDLAKRGGLDCATVAHFDVSARRRFQKTGVA